MPPFLIFNTNSSYPRYDMQFCVGLWDFCSRKKHVENHIPMREVLSSNGKAGVIRTAGSVVMGMVIFKTALRATLVHSIDVG